MSAIRETLKKAAGLFVEFEEDPNAEFKPTKPRETVEEIAHRLPGPDLDKVKVPVTPAMAPMNTVQETPASPVEPVVGPDGTISYQAIYKMANLPEVPFTAEQILELFQTLPADLPLESKRATVRLTLGAMAKNMGVSTEQLVTDASRKLAALASFSETYSAQASEYIEKSTLDILQLEDQIKVKQAGIEAARSKQQAMENACAREADRLDDVLEFFSLDVTPSKHAP